MIQRHPAAWAAARTIAMICQQLVSNMAAANTAEDVACSMRAALALFHNYHNDQLSVANQMPLQDSHVPSPKVSLQNLTTQLESHAAVLGWSEIRVIFLNDQFHTWSAALLAVVVGEWLPKLEGSDREDLWCLVLDTFMQCPAWHVLSALFAHLTTVLPQAAAQAHASSDSLVMAAGADAAARLLLQRFLAPDSAGIWELLTACDANRPDRLPNDTDSSQLDSRTPAAAAATCQYQMDDDQVQEAARMLAALPDRLHVLQPVVQLLPTATTVASTLVLHCIRYLAAAKDDAGQTNASPVPTYDNSPLVELQTTSDCSLAINKHSVAWVRAQHPVHAPAVLSSPGALQLSCSLLQKLVMRGHASALTAVLLDVAVGTVPAVSGPSCSASQVLAEASKGNAVSASPGHSCQDTTEPSSSSSRATEQGLQQAVSGSAANPRSLPAVRCILQCLLCQPSSMPVSEKLVLLLLRTATADTYQEQPNDNKQQQIAVVKLLSPLLSICPQLRTVFLQRLMLKRTLPTRAMQLLFKVLSACQPSMLPEAATTLAEAWSDSSTVQQVPVPQQAYMTAALVACIQDLPKACFDPTLTPKATASADKAAVSRGSQPCPEATVEAAQQHSKEVQQNCGAEPGRLLSLLSAIIQGVSIHLGSPSPAIRLQGMRVGRAFATKLDPCSPVFADVGSLELMPEELWPGVQSAASHQQPVQQQQQQQPPASRHPDVSLEQQGLHWEQSAVRLDQQHTSSTAAQQTATCTRSHKALDRLAEASAEPDSDDEDEVLTPDTLQGHTCSLQGHTSSHTNLPTSSCRSAPEHLPENLAEDDAASLAGSHSSAESLVAFDLQEDLPAEAWWGPDGLGPVDAKALGLRAVAAALRKQDDMAGALEALQKVEILVRAEPDELPVVAPELARSIIHCKVPTWGASSSPEAHAASLNVHTAGPQSGQQMQQPCGANSNAEVQRQKALVAVLALSPLTTGDTVIAELYSPNLDLYQRTLVLDGLASAAVEMSDVRRAPQLAVSGHLKAPELLPPSPATTSASSRSRLTAHEQLDGCEQKASSTTGQTQAAPGLVECSSRVWGRVSLQKQAEAASGVGRGNGSRRRTFRNRFAPVAVRWASALLQQCDIKHHGIDLFGRDSLLLGRLVTVLGTFVEAAAETPAAVPLCAGLLELLRAQEVSAHQEVFVRRSALVAASQVVRHLPPARLAGALVGRQADVHDAVLVERLQWLMSWTQTVAASDADQHCKMLAAGCVAWHVELAEGAMSVLEHLPDSEGPRLTAVQSRSGKSTTRHDSSVLTQIPSLERLVLG